MTAPAAPPFVEVRAIGKRFGSFQAIDDVSFAVARGAFLTLLGPSGSGKSTILRMIAGFERPDHGEIILNGREVERMPAHRRSIGVVFQSLALFPHMTVAENVAYPLQCRRRDRRDIPGLVEKYLGIVRLSGFGGRRIGELSGGQRQRVAIARALVFEPDLLLLDEPLAALDKKLREEVQMEFRRIQSDLGVTTINVTHDQREALVMSDQVMVLDQGRLQQLGPPAEIYRSPANGFVATFIGQTNVFALGAAEARHHFAALAEGRSPRPAAGGGETALRAERIRIAGTAEALDGTELRLPAHIRSVAYEGDRVLYEVDLPGSAAPLRVLSNDPAEPYRPGDPVAIGWQAGDLIDLAAAGPGPSPGPTRL